MSFALKLNIIPDVDTIHSFANETAHEPYTITGTVELELLRPIHIRQLVIGFKGHVDCAISSADFFQDYANKDGDELPYSKWNTAQPKGWVDTLTRKAMGEANATWTIIKKQVTLMQEQQLSIGKSSWPFSITIDNVDALPPSIFIPHHTIQYQLFAQIKLNSIAERIKVSYWQAMTRLFGHLPITTATTTVNVPTALTRTSSNTDSLLFSTMEHTRINTTRHLLGTSTPIQVYRHSYPSLYSLYQIQRVRYRGCRTDHIDYEVSMSKFACLQKKQFGFTCRFMPLCPDATLASIEYYLEQTETYPIRAGEFQQASITFCDSMVPRYRKYSRTFQEMSHYEPGTELDLAISLDLPHIAPDIQTDILHISHKLRFIVRFQDTTKERNMSLSFPIVIGTVPKLRSSIDSGEQQMIYEGDGVRVRQGLDEWLLGNQSLFTPSYFEAYNKLPSYRDAIREGDPPSPFF